LNENVLHQTKMQKIIKEINLEDRLIYWDDDDMEFLQVRGDDDEKGVFPAGSCRSSSIISFYPLPSQELWGTPWHQGGRQCVECLKNRFFWTVPSRFT